MNELLSSIFSVSFGFAILRVTTPILFATLGALISHNAGVMNIGLEGMMISAAFTGVMVSAITHSAWIGLLAAVVVGALMGVFLAYISLNLKSNLMLSGLAINIIASSGTTFLLFMITGQKGISSSIVSYSLPNVDLPLIDKIPIIGDILSGHNVITYFSLIAVVLMYFFLMKTSMGLRIRSVGENPDAASSVGISVIKVKYLALAMSGALAGFGGAFLSMGYVSMFSTNMTSGRGFIALAANAMGGGVPLGAFFASLIFGMADAAVTSIQGLTIPIEFINMTPYLATIAGLIINNTKNGSKNKSKKRKLAKSDV